MLLVFSCILNFGYKCTCFEYIAQAEKGQIRIKIRQSSFKLLLGFILYLSFSQYERVPIYKFNYILQVLIAGLFAINRQLGSNENWNIVFKLAGNLILKIPVNDHKLKEKATPSDEIALMQSVTDLIHLLHNILHWTL